jgi:putative transposase
LWAADITYISTWGGFGYLVTVLDVLSRRIVGWSCANHMRTSLIVDAVDMAVEQRRPGPGLIHHSALQMQSPTSYEEDHQVVAQAA